MTRIDVGRLIARRYLLEERLDAGGRAQVWRATDQELGRPVALKILMTPTDGHAEFLAAFRAEAKIEAQLKHPGIVEVFDWGQDDDANYEVMELLEGPTVAKLIDGGPLPHARVVSIGRQAAAALAYAHSEGIAHGSVTPSHLVVGAQDRAVFIDFGLQCRGTCEYSALPDSDTFALGALLYEMLTGMSPTGPRPVDLPERAPWPDPPHTLVPNIPHDLSYIVMKAIAPNPAERYASAAELEAALDGLVRPKSRTWLWASLAVLAVVVVAGAWYLSSRPTLIVPDVTGMTSAQAEATLSSAGLTMVTAGQSPSPSAVSGTIIAEEPPAGTRVGHGAQIGVTVSTGKPSAVAPALTGLSLQAASSAVASEGLAVGSVKRENSTTFPDNTVISQSPSAGSQMTAGDAVDLIVSSGQAQTTVPDVRGMSEADATTKLEDAGLVVDSAKAYSSQPKGIVVTQGPAAGTTVASGSTVTISISKGSAPVTVPDVTGAQESDAKTSLQALGLVPVSVPTTGTPSQVGTVISQSPDAGSTVAKGSQVQIDVGK